MTQENEGWEQLESSVYYILENSGIEVRRNCQIGHQQVDLFAVRRDFGHPTRIAVECKAYKQSLRKNHVANIYAKYEALYETNLIDEILIVTESDITANTKQYVESKRHLQHITHRELLASAMDFSMYTNHLIDSFSADGLSEYYSPMRAFQLDKPDETFDLFEFTQRWIGARDAMPLALLSGYGMGKTTFTRYLAYRLAVSWRDSHSDRIPILIDLGKVADEQYLDGLLGKLFTSGNVVRGYSFKLFMQLNRLGRFVVIFDSFDEMKHGITWPTFFRNFTEIRRLIDGDSRVIVCGRPSVFMSETERRGVLDDEDHIGSKWIRRSAFSGFKEISLAPLNRVEIERFLYRYLGYIYSSNHSVSEKSERVLRRIQETGAKQLYDLAKRPVQLKMLATILPDWEKPLDQLSLIDLYDLFIDVIIQRDCEKLARRRIDTDLRREFARNLAWYMWTEKHRDFIRTDEIPDTVFRTVQRRTNLSGSALQRELIVACALEVKVPDLLFFPHRSIQEFLVAEKIRQLIRHADISFDQLLSQLTPEISDFLNDRIDMRDLLGWSAQLISYRGPLRRRIDAILEPIWDMLAHMGRDSRRSPWPGLFFLRSILERVDLYNNDDTPNLYKERQTEAHSGCSMMLEVGTVSYVHYAIHLLLSLYFPLPSTILATINLSDYDYSYLDESLFLMVMAKENIPIPGNIVASMRRKDKSCSLINESNGTTYAMVRDQADQNKVSIWEFSRHAISPPPDHLHAFISYLKSISSSTELDQMAIRSAETLQELITAISLYPNSRKIEVGPVRTMLRKYYRETSILPSMLAGNVFLPGYDFASEIAVQQNAAFEELQDLLDSIRTWSRK